MHHDLHAGQGLCDSLSCSQVAVHRIHMTAWIAAEDARAMSGLAEQPNHMAAECARSTGDEDVQRSLSPKKASTRRHESSAADLSYDARMSLKNEWRAPG